jgi:hypothetical protein
MRYRSGSPLLFINARSPAPTVFTAASDVMGVASRMGSEPSAVSTAPTMTCRIIKNQWAKLSS